MLFLVLCPEIDCFYWTLNYNWKYRNVLMFMKQYKPKCEMKQKQEHLKYCTFSYIICKVGVTLVVIKKYLIIYYSLTPVTFNSFTPYKWILLSTS